MSRDIKYIGYLESQIADTMWPSGLCREERKPFHKSASDWRPPGLTPPCCST